MADAARRYPVIVTVTHEHVVWVEGDSPDDAVHNFQSDGDWYERISNQETLATFWHDSRKPAAEHYSLDWDTVENGEPYGGPYAGIRCDAHVEAWHRENVRVKYEAGKAACAAAGHPKQRQGVLDEALCPTCGYLRDPAPTS